MAQGIQPNEKLCAREVYGDIIDIVHWEPNRKHPRMSLHDRAAQFAPFAALAGYDEMVEEEARLTDRQIELADGQKDQMDRIMNRITELLFSGIRPEVSITYFIPDEHKTGGRYASITARIRRIDPQARKIILDCGLQTDLPETIDIDRIIDITGDQIGSLDDEF